MFTQFSLFQSHLDLAHRHWKRLITPNDTVIDATCGNGYDTLYLASLSPKKLYAIDIQEDAIQATHQRLREKGLESAVSLIHGCHSTFPEEILPETVKLIVYNLGYLPGGDKTRTTRVDTTLESLNSGLILLKEGGVISITCYPGHPEGGQEQGDVLEFAASLDPKTWSCCHHTWTNRQKAPSLLLIQKGQSLSDDA